VGLTARGQRGFRALGRTGVLTGALTALAALLPAAGFAAEVRLFTLPSGNRSLQYSAAVGETNDVKLERIGAPCLATLAGPSIG
jgi:hypothetical protein